MVTQIRADVGCFASAQTYGFSDVGCYRRAAVVEGSSWKRAR